MAATFTASVFREGNWWLIDVHDVGVTQCADLDRAEATAVDLIATVHDLDPATVRVEMVEVQS